MASTSTRPVTSKPRGVCRYYNAPRGCFAGDKCKFLHGEPPIEAKPEDPPMLTPYDKAKRCRYYAQGFCKRGEACWFLHSLPTDSLTSMPPANEEEDEYCSICFDKPATYGLLSGCSHIFCTTCIKQWRDKKPTLDMHAANTKKCPMCRTPSKFITPSSKFWKEGTEEKGKVMQSYKESMARVPCRYFQKSLKKSKDRPMCPYGKDCFYQHLKEDGTPFVFKEGVEVCLKRYRTLQQGWPSFDEAYMPFSLDLSSLDIALAGPEPVIGGPIALVHLEPGRRDEEAQNIGTISYAARRLRDVGRSLEMLNDAIGEGATLESLDHAVEALRAGLGRLEGAAAAGGRNRRRTRENGVNDEDGAGSQDEDDVMERLEILAEQMMVSINAIRMNEDGGAGEEVRADTPPPPLEAIEDVAIEAVVAEHRERRESTGYGSDSMPSLQSVSDTSSEEDDDESEDEEEGEIGSGNVLSQEEETTEWGREGGEAEQAHTNAENGAFVTDGRGRVVWSSEESKSGEERGTGTGTQTGTGTETETETETETGIETGTGTEAESGTEPETVTTTETGRETDSVTETTQTTSLLDWINRLLF